MGVLLFLALGAWSTSFSGILYESFIHPLTILSGLPSAAMGALLILFLVGLPLTLYAFVGLIMLIGIVKKNAIMMIDFALHRQRNDNASRPQQAHPGSGQIRFRPIMIDHHGGDDGQMLPIALGLGAGARIALADWELCVAGGLLFSQALTLYITLFGDLHFSMDRMGNVVCPGRTPTISSRCRRNNRQRVSGVGEISSFCLAIGDGKDGSG